MAYPVSSDYKADEITLARFAKALGHPARVAIMKQLASMSDCCFTDILKGLPISQSTVSQHLSELKDAGLIKGNINPPRVLYCINAENWKKAKELFQCFLDELKSRGDHVCC